MQIEVRCRCGKRLSVRSVRNTVGRRPRALGEYVAQVELELGMKCGCGSSFDEEGAPVERPPRPKAEESEGEYVAPEPKEPKEEDGEKSGKNL